MSCRRQRPCPQSCTFSVWQTPIQSSSTSTCGLALPVALPLACLARCHNYSVTGTGTPDCFTTDRCKQSLGNLACLRLALLPTHTGTDPENASHLGRTTAITTGSNSPCGLALCTCCRSLLPLSTRISQCTTGNATPGLWDRFRQGVGPQQACLPFLSCAACTQWHPSQRVMTASQPWNMAAHSCVVPQVQGQLEFLQVLATPAPHATLLLVPPVASTGAKTQDICQQE